ncbi:MAG: hypothetical protein PVG30_02070 [Gammaproteobacteria bacterium]|jgi:hypothetical protein
MKTINKLRTKKTIMLFDISDDNIRRYKNSFISNGYKVYKSNLNHSQVIPTNQIKYDTNDNNSKYLKAMYAIDYKNPINGKKLYVKSWIYIPYDFLQSFVNYDLMFCELEYYITNYLKNRCLYIMKYH